MYAIKWGLKVMFKSDPQKLPPKVTSKIVVVIFLFYATLLVFETFLAHHFQPGNKVSSRKCIFWKSGPARPQTWAGGPDLGASHELLTSCNKHWDWKQCVVNLCHILATQVRDVFLLTMSGRSPNLVFLSAKLLFLCLAGQQDFSSGKLAKVA